MVQMAGKPGSGKSTLARGIGAACEAVVLDKDVIKSAALSVGAPEELAAPLAYEVFFDLAASLLDQGCSVVLDSPAFFVSIPEKGWRIASEHGVAYHVIECVCPDPAEQEARLRAGARLRSQPRSVAEVRASLARPGIVALAELHLEIDTTQPLDACLELALRYLNDGQG